MEEEINYSTVTFKNSAAASKVKEEEATIYSETKPQGAATPVQNVEAAARRHVSASVACSGVLCLLLVASVGALIYMFVVMKEQTANNSELSAENQQLISDRKQLQREAEQLSRARDELSWTLGVILRFNSFPVNDFCPDKKCQPCQRGWVLFEEKCYLFYNEKAPWKTWQQSRKYCQNKAADLVVVDSLREQEFISNHTEFYHDGDHGFWLGLQETRDHIWVWLDGRNDTLGYWMEEELGNPGPFALMIPGRDFTASWDPADHVMENKFICETEVLIRSN